MFAGYMAGKPDYNEGEQTFTPVEKLIGLLRMGDARSRERSARALGDMMDRRGVPALIGALRDDNVAVRKSALHALGKIKDPSSVGAITSAIRQV